MHMPFGSMVKIEPLTQFSVEQLFHSVISSLVFFLRQVAIIALYAINRLISVFTQSTILCIIYLILYHLLLFEFSTLAVAFWLVNACNIK